MTTTAPSPWREMDTQRVTSATVAAREMQGLEEEPSSPDGVPIAAAAAGVGLGDDSGGNGGGAEAEWACNSCTFLNDRGASRCNMCGTRMPPEERPPDRSYRDTLVVDGDGLAERGLRRQLGRRPQSAAEAMTEAELCRYHEQSAGGGVSTSGGGTGGYVYEIDSSDDDGFDSETVIADAVAGSAVGALSAGVTSALTPGSNRLGRVMASLAQGALIGGVAGAALGNSLRQESRRGDSRRESDRERVDFNVGTDPFAEFLRQQGREPPSPPHQRQLQRRDLSTSLHDTQTREYVTEDLEMLMLTHHLRVMGLSEATMRAIMADVHTVPDNQGRARPASAGAIAALPSETMTAASLSHLTEDRRQCCICLEDFDAGEVATRLPCLHLYHALCIGDWLQTSGTCPQCKHRVD